MNIIRCQSHWNHIDSDAINNDSKLKWVKPYGLVLQGVTEAQNQICTYALAIPCSPTVTLVENA